MPAAISVLLPVRDAAPYLPECIASLRAQTFEDFEVLAVDDGSTDDSPGLLSAWAREDSRVSVVHQPPGGIVLALEAGRTSARGRYLARMDADDIAEPTRFAEQFMLLEGRPDLAGCGAGVRYFPRAEVRGGGRRYEDWINGMRTPEDVERNLFIECPLAHPTFFLRTAIVAEVGGYVDRGWPEDYDLILRLWRSSARLAAVDRVLLQWRIHRDRASVRHESYTPEAFRRCKVHYLLETLARGRDGLVVWGAGPIGKAFAREVQAQGGSVRAFVDLDPRKIDQRIHGAPVIHPSGIDEYRDGFSVAAVGQEGARHQICSELELAGWEEVADFVAVA
ncbi:MAG: glycosyl transferase [Gemmatimonadetes bacterium]|nr:glycosyl transferase [Gemmatimonadota bacterium]